MTDKEVETKDDAQAYTDGEVENHRANGEHDTAQPPKSHGNPAHDVDYATLADVPESYTDGDAISAVDGSNVSVGYADNAGQLGGQNPSFFETPNSTANGQASGGYETLVDVTNVTLNGYTNPDEDYSTNFGDALIDEVTVTFSQTSQITFSVDVAGQSISSAGTYTFNPTVDNYASISASSNSTDDENFSLKVEIHKIPAGVHSHNL